MADHDEPRSEVNDFLRARAGELDRHAPPVSPGEAAERVVPRSLEPRRWTHAPAASGDRARRVPAIAAATVAALLIGSVAGFAAGRGSAPDDVASARGAAQDTTTPTVVASAEASGAGGSRYLDMMYGPGNAPTVTRLFIRSTAENVALRGYLQRWDMEVNEMNIRCDPNSWCPPPECNSPDSFLAELSNFEAVTQSGAQLWPLRAPAATRGEVPLGLLEGAPVSAWMVQANGDVATVRGTWPDGFSDEMAPVDGWAIVAHTGTTAPSSLQALLRDGSAVDLETDGNAVNGFYPAECSPPPPPPPELPPAGTEQPADVEAASEGVRTAYTQVFNHEVPPEDKGAYIEDNENLKEQAERTQANFPQAAETIVVEVGEIRFLSATDAALYFELKYEGGALFGKQVGYARLIDGVWKIARDTMCMVYGWAGAPCSPPPDPARSGGGYGYGYATEDLPAKGEG